MTLYQYRMLDESEQKEQLCMHGVQVAERKDDVQRYVLYQIFAFYIELKYGVESSTLHSSRAFCSLIQLEPYLESIDISQLPC